MENTKKKVRHGAHWAVLFGSFLSFFIVDGWSFSFPMLFPDLVKEFKESRGKTSYVPTLLYALPLLLSHLACTAIPRIGCRKLGIFGGLTIGISLVLASVSNSYWTLLVAVGVLTSIALVAMYISAYVAVTYWFDDCTRGQATGIAVTGSGLGSVIFPHLMEWLKKWYEWRGMVLIMAGVCMHATISGCLYRPFPQAAEQHAPPLEDAPSEQLLTPQGTTEPQEITCKSIFKSSIPQVSLLSKHALFALFCIGNFLLYLWVSIPYLYIFDWALEGLNKQPEEATWILSAIGLARTLGQVLIGVFVDRVDISANLVLAISALTCAISVFLIPFSFSFSSLLVLVITFAFAVSSTYVLPMLCMGEIIGLDQAVPGLGVLQFFQGVATLAGSPLGGWIHDWSGGYERAFFISGAGMCLSALLLATIPCLLKRRAKDCEGGGLLAGPSTPT